MIALAVFIIALLLAIEAVEPTGGWLVTLAVLSGIDMFSGGGIGGPVPVRAWVPASINRQHGFAIGLTLFIVALLLAIDAVEPTPPWLVTIAVLSGIQAFVPRGPARGWRGRLRAWAGGSGSDDDAW